MSESVEELPDRLDASSSCEEPSSHGGRMRSISEVYSIGNLSSGNEAHERVNEDEVLAASGFVSPILPRRGSKEEESDIHYTDNGIVLGATGFDKGKRKESHQIEHRGRLFSELSISDMPTETDDESQSGAPSLLGVVPPLDISFPCNYEDNMESRGQSILQLHQAAIKRVLIRSGARISRFNIVYSKVGYYWPQETIRHCRTGRIKRGMVLKRQFGVYYPDKTRDFVALKIMEKSAISECFQWNEDDVQTELGVMKELSCDGGHENVLFLYDNLETKDYLIAVMELVNGDLHDMLPSIKDTDTINSVFAQILKGYKFITDHGYYHCDLSLENVTIKLEPNYKGSGKTRIVAKLTDFGRVRKMDENGHATIDGDEVAGKPYYLAPEAYCGSYEAGPADVWSLGVILFIMITNNPPFGIANDSDEVFEPFSTEGFKYLEPALRRARATEDQIELLSRLLCIIPEDRPSVDDLLKLPWL